MIWSICGDNTNNVYLYRFDINCQLIDSHEIENRKSTLAINQNRQAGLSLGDNEFLTFIFENDHLNLENTTYLQDCKMDINSREKKHLVLFPEENIELDLNEIWPNEIGHTLIGFDRERNLYFNLYSKPLHDSSLGIISSSGDVINTNITLPHYTEFGLDFGKGIPNQAAPNGTIYQMIPMIDKIEIRKWKKVTK